MTVHITCPGCQREYQLSDTMRGKHQQCGQCGNVIAIPAAAASADDVWLDEVELFTDEDESTVFRPSAPRKRTSSKASSKGGLPGVYLLVGGFGVLVLAILAGGAWMISAIVREANQRSEYERAVQSMMAGATSNDDWQAAFEQGFPWTRHPFPQDAISVDIPGLLAPMPETNLSPGTHGWDATRANETFSIIVRPLTEELAGELPPAAAEKSLLTSYEIYREEHPSIEFSEPQIVRLGIYRGIEFREVDGQAIGWKRLVRLPGREISMGLVVRDGDPATPPPDLKRFMDSLISPEFPSGAGAAVAIIEFPLD